jgi:thiamine kinase-like enzyme
MKKSNYCKVMSEDKKIVKYQRRIGITQEYYRSIPESEVLEILSKYGMNVPKVLELYDDYFVEEYIDGTLLDDIYTDYSNIDKIVIDDIINNIVGLIRIDFQSLSKYSKWNNVRGFFEYQILNTEEIWNEYNTSYDVFYNLLGINKSTIFKLKQLSKKINFNRPLCLIHGDRHKNNMIKKDNQVYYIDWELSCVGDLAYDIAFHIHQMKYSEADLKYFLLNLENRLPYEYKSAINDINIYLCFITMRSVIYYVKILYDCDYSEKLLDKFYIRLQKLCEYTELGIKLVSKNDIKTLLMK